MTIASTADVEAILQVDIQPDDDPRVVILLEMADELIDDALGRPAAGGTEVTELHRATGYQDRVILLDRWPVTAIGTVTVDGEAVTAPADFGSVLDAGIIRRAFGYFWTFNAEVSVVYTPATIPGFRPIAAGMVARALRAGNAYAATLDAGLAGFKSLSIGRWSASADTPSTGLAAAGEAIYLTATEKATVEGWRDRRP